MFGLFNRKKKIAHVISVSVLNTFRSCFALTKHLDDNHRFQPPYGFWQDPYVIGFAYSLMSWFLHFDFAGSTMKADEKGRIVILTFMNMCGDDYRQAMTLANESAMTRQNAEFNRGYDHALTLYGSTTGRLKEADADPILAEAKELAEKLHDMHIGFSSLSDVQASTNSSIGAAVIDLTIKKHIEDRYLKAA